MPAMTPPPGPLPARSTPDASERALLHELGQFAHAASQLRASAARRDLEAIDALAEAIGPRASSVRRLAGKLPDEGLEILQLWVEAWDKVLREYWLADDGPPERALAFALPSADGFGWPILQLNAWWLRLTRSPLLAERADSGSRLEPNALRGQPLLVQARRLARFTVGHDACVPIDYAGVAKALDSGLRPLWATWFLDVYMTSPEHHLDPGVCANREAAMASFADFHEHQPARVAPSLLHAHAAFRAAYLTDAPCRFVNAVGRSVLVPLAATSVGVIGRPPNQPNTRELSPRSRSLSQPTVERAEVDDAPQGAPQAARVVAPQADASRSAPGPEASPTKAVVRPVSGGLRQGRVGVVLSCFREGHAVQRCIDPVLEGLRESGVVAFYLDGDVEHARSRLPAHWHGGEGSSVELVTFGGPCFGVDELARAARAIERRGLDLLIFPEVGLSPASRFLAYTRCARVQAACYGHPITTGSPHVDFFLGGAAVDGDAEARGRYRERLILLPGIGVGTTEPPRPSGPRERPFDGSGEYGTLALTMASFEKLTPALVEAWRDGLSGHGGEVTLAMLSGLPDHQMAMAGGALGPHFKGAGVPEVVLMPRQPRQACVDLVAEADLYLDSWPFGGFNTVVEALSVGLPVVTRRAGTAVSRVAAAVMGSLGLPEWLMAESTEGYVAACRRLTSDAAAREDIRARLDRGRVLAAVQREGLGDAMLRAVDAMLAADPGPGAPIRV